MTNTRLGVLAGVLLGATAMTPAFAADMTMDRANNVGKEPQNWILHHQNYEGHRYSALKEINLDTVKGLKIAFTVALGGFQSGGRYQFGNLEGTPLVEDGMMYVTDGWGSVYQIDVTSGRKGQIKWKMDPGTDRAWAGDVACCGVNNRGVAFWKDKVISAVLDGRLEAINKATGELIWERKVGDPAVGETVTLAPLVVRDTAIIGSAGGEFGIRGWIDGTDLNTGKQKWRTYTIPGKGEPGNETWKDGKDHWMHGGASIWVTATYDKDLDLFYQGVGNAGPDWDPEYRPGDNKWAASVLAMSPDTGKIAWGYQYTPNDPYDYDEISEHPLITVKVDGQDRKLVTHAGRNGFFYALDRANGSFVGGKAYSDGVTWASGLDPKTGKPIEYDPSKDVQTYAQGSHGSRAVPKGKQCPTVTGGKNWEPTAYDPTLNIVFVPGAEGCQPNETIAQADFADQGGALKPRDRFTGGSPAPAKKTGSIKAIDPITGTTKYKVDLPYANFSGMLATAGGLAFAGHYDGTFSAYDSKTLKEVWNFNIGTGINAPAMTYSVGGKQYIAVLAGSIMSAGVVSFAPELKNNSTASMLYVFTL